MSVPVCRALSRGKKATVWLFWTLERVQHLFLNQLLSLRGVDFEIGACCWDSSQQHKGRPFGGRFERRGKEARKDYTYFHLDWRRKAQGCSRSLYVPLQNLYYSLVSSHSRSTCVVPFQKKMLLWHSSSATRSFYLYLRPSHDIKKSISWDSFIF